MFTFRRSMNRLIFQNFCEKKIPLQLWKLLQTFAIISKCPKTPVFSVSTLSVLLCKYQFSLHIECLPHSCAACDCSENLWLCLSCGYSGCGRRQFDGTGGNGHAMEHFKTSCHAIAIKTGTISPGGAPGQFSLSCPSF